MIAAIVETLRGLMISDGFSTTRFLRRCRFDDWFRRRAISSRFPARAIAQFPGPQSAGLLIQRVAEGSPAASLGLRGGTVRATFEMGELLVGGDIVLEAAGTPFSDESGAFEKVHATVSALPPGAPLIVKVLRAGKVIELSIILPSSRVKR